MKAVRSPPTARPWVTSIHIEDSDGEPDEFTFHNRNNSDCLAKKLSLLRSQFIAAH